MLAALALTPSASAPRVKLLCSATATNTRRLASGARRYAARAAIPAGERWETRPAPAGAGGAAAPFFRRLPSRFATVRSLINHLSAAPIIRAWCAGSAIEPRGRRQSLGMTARRAVPSLQQRLTVLQLF